jgi:preprotein translocase subunit SecA
MAGRGTDIKLTPDSVKAGGLYILGTERHESRRIDNQLRGRSGRQGDPGESRFYISLEDDLIRIFAGDTIQKNMKRVGMTEDETIESSFISKTIERSQEKVEKHNFETRRHLLEYDDVLNQQRIVIYKYRRSILEGAQEIYDLVRDLISQSVNDMVNEFAPGRPAPEGVEKIMTMLGTMTGMSQEDLQKHKFNTSGSESLKSDITNFLLQKYESYRTQQDAERIQEAEKWLMLEILDNAWKQHMLNLDHLKEGINLRSWGQKNPLIEYKREAFDMFKEMMQQVRWDIVHHIFHLNLERFNQHELERKRQRELDELNLISASMEAQEGHKPIERTEEKIGRNDPCSCGSGKKYKKCHGLNK